MCSKSQKRIKDIRTVVYRGEFAEGPVQVLSEPKNESAEKIGIKFTITEKKCLNLHNSATEEV